MLMHVLPLVLALSGQTTAQVPPPTAPARVATPQPAAPPSFDEKADAAGAIATAVKAAATDDIRVLVIWGANNDAGWAAFTGARRAPEVAQAKPSFFSDEYRVVNVNVGHLDANVDLAKKYNATPRAGELPALTILDASGHVLANTTVASFRSADTSALDAATFASFLKSHQAPPPNDAATFEAAVKQAKTADKTVFVWFSAPWCGWCHRLGAWMATKDAATLLDKEFVFAKLDFDRGIGAHEVETRYIDKEQGLPWIVFVDGNGRALINSTRPATDPHPGNIGHPNQPDEVAYFKTMLNKAKKHLTDADIAYLIDSLVAFNKVANGK
jgi:thiol-disulfide isomerase/thioredoxin